jgi:hypothetical protein
MSGAKKVILQNEIMASGKLLTLAVTDDVLKQLEYGKICFPYR